MKFREWLLTNPSTRTACQDSLEWIGDRTFQQAWDECDRPDWLLWLCDRMADRPGWPTRQQIVLIACDIARGVLDLTRPEDRDVCIAAIVAAEAWANGTGTAAAARVAADAAYDAAYAAARAADAKAYDAAYAAAYAAAAYAAAADAAARAAARAADAAADAAYAVKRKYICELIRQRIDISKAEIADE